MFPSGRSLQNKEVRRGLFPGYPKQLLLGRSGLGVAGGFLINLSPRGLVRNFSSLFLSLKVVTLSLIHAFSPNSSLLASSASSSI